MKITKIALACLTAATFATTACSDDTYDIDGSSDNLAYIYQLPGSNGSLPQNSYAFTMAAFPTWGVEFFSKESSEYQIRLTQVAKTDVTVNLGVDAAALEEGYELLPESAYKMSATSVKIPAGSQSAVFSVDFTDYKAIEADKDYMLPVVISSVDGAVKSENLGKAFIYASKENKTISTSRTGDEITDRDGWNVLYDGERYDTDGADANEMINNPNSYSYWFNGTAVHPIEVNFGKKISNVTGLKVNFFNRNYCARAIKIYASESDTAPYVEVGSVTYDASDAIAIISWDNGKPVDAQRIRIDATPWNGNGIVPKYLTFYQN